VHACCVMQVRILHSFPDAAVVPRDGSLVACPRGAELLQKVAGRRRDRDRGL
jgi:hypothetical protein